MACKTIAFPTKVKRLRKYKSIPVGIIIAAGIRPAELAADGEEEEEDDQPLSSNNCVVTDDLLFSSSSDSLLVHNSDGFGYYIPKDSGIIFPKSEQAAQWV